MDRRKFFRNMLGGSAAIAIAPKLLDQIIEQDYSAIPLDEKVADLGLKTEPFESNIVPFGKTGIWIFRNELLIAYGGIMGVTISIDRPLIEVASSSGYVEFIGGTPEGRWHIDDLIIVDQNAFDRNEIMHILFTTPDHGTIESDIVWDNVTYSTSFMIDETIQQVTSANFRIVGEAIIY